jgi:hypothetical protein
MSVDMARVYQDQQIKFIAKDRKKRYHCSPPNGIDQGNFTDSILLHECKVIATLGNLMMGSRGYGQWSAKLRSSSESWFLPQT